MAQVHYVIMGDYDDEVVYAYLSANKGKINKLAKDFEETEDEDGATRNSIWEQGSEKYKDSFMLVFNNGEMYCEAATEEDFRNKAENMEYCAFFTGLKDLEINIPILNAGYDEDLEWRDADYYGDEPKLVWADYEYIIGESKQTTKTMKYVPTFESFIGSQKLKEGFLDGYISSEMIRDEVIKLFEMGLGIKKVYAKLKKSPLLKGTKHDFNGVLIRIEKYSGEIGRKEATSINIWEPKNEEKAMSTHQKEHGFPLDTSNDAVIRNDYQKRFAIYMGFWENPKGQPSKKWKVNDFLPLSASGDEGLGDGAEEKWRPVLDAMNVSYLDDLVWLGTYFPEIVQEEGKEVKSFDLDDLGDEDPHGDVSISIYKWKGMLLAEHTDDYRYYGTLCKAKDSVKLAKLLENDEGIDLGE